MISLRVLYDAICGEDTITTTTTLYHYHYLVSLMTMMVVYPCIDTFLFIHTITPLQQHFHGLVLLLIRPKISAIIVYDWSGLRLFNQINSIYIINLPY